jgi:tetratricopeptide (TPR) repeat protein
VSGKKLLTFFILLSLVKCLLAQLMNDSLPGSIGFGAQIPAVQGQIQGLHGAVMDLEAILFDSSGVRRIQQVEVAADGTFQLNRVPAGTYLLRLAQAPNEVIAEQLVQIGNIGEPVTMLVPESSREPAAATVSADQLQHPLSRKGVKMIRKAQSDAAAGDHVKAIDDLKQALKEPSAVPYAHSLLGQEYLKTRQFEPALDELEQASNLLPHDAIIHSNLGYALFVKGDAAHAEREVRRALELDGANSAAQRLLGYILKARQAAPGGFR